MMIVGDPNRHRPPEPHLQTMRIPTMADLDFAALRRERLERLQAMMKKRGIPIALLLQPPRTSLRHRRGRDGGVDGDDLHALLLRHHGPRPHPLRIPELGPHCREIVKDVRPHRGHQYMGHQGYGLARSGRRGSGT